MARFPPTQLNLTTVMQRLKKLRLLRFLVGLVPALLTCLPPGARADVVTDWNEQLERANKTAAVSAALQARICATVSAAVYDAVNGLALTYQPYFIHERGPLGARQDAAAAQAAYTALVGLFPTQAVTFDAALATSLTQITNSGASSNAIAQGRAWGESVAQRVLAWRAQDGLANPAPNYFGGTNVGQWRSVPTPTAPDGTLPAIVPQMPTLVPFAMTSPSQFRPGPPYGLPLAQALASAQYAADLNEVKALGRIDSVTRTAEQTSIARLWQASSTAELNNCLRQVLPATNSLADNARLLALANIVAADGLIAGFDSKYTYNFWRPHHAIRFADLDGNPATEADPEWSALIIAPRHQEYISNHASHSGGFAYAVRRLLGDAHTFTLGSMDFPSFTWTFHSWSEVMAQVKEARIWGGIHYRNSCDVGEVAGRSIADYVIENHFRPATPLVITQQPRDQAALGGDSATYTVAATGTGPLSYQWRAYANPSSYTNIPGATSATLVLTDVQPTSHRFGVVVTDGFGASVTSSPLARLLVFFAPSITTQPSSHTAVAGESDSLNVQAGGTPPLDYHWYFNGQPLHGATSTNVTFASVQPSNAGNYQVIITNLYGAATSQVAALTVVPATLFAKITDGPVATVPGQCTGAVWADFNNDGWLDLYVVQFEGANRFYRNTGNGNFTRVTQGDFLITDNKSLGASAMDYDNDGYPDLAIASGGCCDDSPGHHFLFHNNGDGTFTRDTAGGIGNAIGHFFATDWADYDSDGFLDALITSTGGTDSSGNYRGGPNQLWHSNGDGTFTRVTTGPIATDRGIGEGALWFDYDGDGRLDVLTLNYVYNAGGTNYLYHNEGNGVFARNLTSPIGTDFLTGGSEGADWGDYDNDGLSDLFVVDPRGVRNHLYHNNGGGSFSNITSGPMLTPPSGSNPHVPSWGDYDNDGYLDLVISYADRNVLYRNNRDGTFSTILRAGFANDTVFGIYFFNNVSWADYDNDGFLDLFVTLGNNTGTPSDDRPNYLYHNSGNSNGWLEVKCVGTVANRSAVGARIRAKATINGKTFWQVRELKSSAGWGLATPLVAHFGLGDATSVETLRVEWPSGTVQELHNLSTRQILTVTEPPRLTATKVSGQPQFTLKGGRNMTYAIESSANLRDWSAVATLTVTNMNGTARITDINTPGDQRFYRAVGP